MIEIASAIQILQTGLATDYTDSTDSGNRIRANLGLRLWTLRTGGLRPASPSVQSVAKPVSNARIEEIRSEVLK